jgi:hypothetical protein
LAAFFATFLAGFLASFFVEDFFLIGMILKCLGRC